jgi:hypothetical protein
VREDVALGIASAAPMCGERGAVVLQNSGLGNLVNALTSFNLIYHVPALLVVGWRGYQGADKEADFDPLVASTGVRRAHGNSWDTSRAVTPRGVRSSPGARDQRSRFGPGSRCHA